MKKKQRAKTSQANKLTSAKGPAKATAAKSKLAKKKPSKPAAEAKAPNVAKASAASKAKKQDKAVAATPKKAPAKSVAAPKDAAPKKKGKATSVAVAPTLPVPSGESKGAAKQARDAAKEAAARQQVLFNDLGTGPAEGRGNRVPEFSLHDQNGKTITLSDFAGKPFVLYFYPKDDTPGCTKEACDFRDELAAFTAAGVRVIGVSPDSHASHKKFASKYGVNFTLLSDPEKALANKLGVWQMKKNYGREYMGIVRSTFLVDASGVIRRAWRSVKVAGHVPAVLKAIATGS